MEKKCGVRLFDYRKKHRAYRRSSGLGRKHLRKDRWKNPYQWGCLFSILLLLSLILLLIFGIRSCARKKGEEPKVEDSSQEVVQEKEPLYQPTETDQTVSIDEAVESEYGVLLEMESGRIIAERNSKEQINPASMTKVLTLLVAAEEITDRSGTFTITEEITDYCYFNDCSVVGYEIGEEVPVTELFYGCILCSGADASLALAELACGSHEAFVAKMNEKIKELGRADTAHFTNCVGLYDEAHYCTVQDMAVFLKAALDDPFCREVLSTRTYDSAPTASHPEGQLLSNWFVRRIEDRDTGDVAVPGGKTGFVVESKNCAASFGKNSSGEEFICVTAMGSGAWQVIDDHAALYKEYCAVTADSEKKNVEIS